MQNEQNKIWFGFIRAVESSLGRNDAHKYLFLVSLLWINLAKATSYLIQVAEARPETRKLGRDRDPPNNLKIKKTKAPFPSSSCVLDGLHTYSTPISQGLM